MGMKPNGEGSAYKREGSTYEPKRNGKMVGYWEAYTVYTADISAEGLPAAARADSDRVIQVQRSQPRHQS
jgi:hypothetical protein